MFTDDYPKLGDSVWHSLNLLAGGYLIGAVLGFIAGVAIGWSRAVGYWAHPVLRLVGPLPAPPGSLSLSSPSPQAIAPARS